MPDPYSTHLPVIVGLIAACRPRRVIDLGVGRYSTLAWVAYGAETWAIEDMHAEWFRVMKRDLDGVGNIHWECIVGAGLAHRWLQTMAPVDVDIVCVDNRADARADCVRAGWHVAHTVMAHDTEAAHDEWYHVRSIPIPAGWERVDFSGCSPASSVWTRQPGVAEKLRVFLNARG